MWIDVCCNLDPDVDMDPPRLPTLHYIRGLAIYLPTYIFKQTRLVLAVDSWNASNLLALPDMTLSLMFCQDLRHNFPSATRLC